MLTYNVFYGGTHVTVNVHPQCALNAAKNPTAAFCSRHSETKTPEIAQNTFSFRAIGPAIHSLHSRRVRHARSVAVMIVVIAVVIPPEQIRHHFGVAIARMVQARKPESTFDCSEQREVRVAPRALHAVDPVV